LLFKIGNVLLVILHHVLHVGCIEGRAAHSPKLLQVALVLCIDFCLQVKVLELAKLHQFAVCLCVVGDHTLGELLHLRRRPFLECKLA